MTAFKPIASEVLPVNSIPSISRPVSGRVRLAADVAARLTIICDGQPEIEIFLPPNSAEVFELAPGSRIRAVWNHLMNGSMTITSEAAAA